MEPKNVDAVKRFYGYVDSGKPEALGTLFAPEAKVFYESSDPVLLDNMIPVIKTFYASFPDFKHIIEDIFEVGDRVVARMSFTGTLGMVSWVLNQMARVSSMWVSTSSNLVMEGYPLSGLLRMSWA